MKHRIKLCTKIQIYYSYCIPFSTDFLRLFFQFSRQQHSQVGKTRVLPGPGAGGSCRPRSGGWLPEGHGHHRARGWQRPLAGAPAPTPSQVTLAPSWCFGTAPSLTVTPQGLRARLTCSRRPWAPWLAALGDGSSRALHCHPPAASMCPAPLAAAPLPQGCPSRGHGPAVLPAPGSVQLCPWPVAPRGAGGPARGPAKSPRLLALRRGQC